MSRKLQFDGKSDTAVIVIAGSTLGTLIALLIYHIWWPSPFTSANFDTMGVPRKSHADNDVNAETQDLLNDADQV